MGKLLSFPSDRLRQRPRPVATALDFGAFAELARAERAQLKLMAVLAGFALLCLSVLQIVVG
jgi:hypothetical protein